MAAKVSNATGTKRVRGFSELLDLKPLCFLLPVYPPLVCDICGLITKSPTDPGCGHFYCSVCVEQVRSDKSDVKCPLDQKEVKPNLPVLDVPWAEASVTNSRIRCPNASGGCQYISEPTDKKDLSCGFSAMIYLEDHYRECSYLQIPCPSCELPVLQTQTVNHLQHCCGATGGSQKDFDAVD